jgi:hypothetical protein
MICRPATRPSSASVFHPDHPRPAHAHRQLRFMAGTALSGQQRSVPHSPGGWSCRVSRASHSSVARATIDPMNAGGSPTAWSPPAGKPAAGGAWNRRPAAGDAIPEIRPVQEDDSARTGHSVLRGHDGFAIDR